MAPSLTDILCTRCGLCCDGTLFADVELTGRDESAGLEILGLDIDEDEAGGRGLMLLPCRALQGTRCGIYPHRPDTCRTFECRLLDDVRSDRIDVERAKARIAEARALITRVDALVTTIGPADPRLPMKERCAEVLAASEDRDASAASRKRRAELETAMASLERVVRESFLPD